MRNAHVVEGWKLTPASSKTNYDAGGHQTSITVEKLDSRKGADGYHVESPEGACFFVQKWDHDNTWTSQDLNGKEASFFLKHTSPSLKLLLERLRNTARARELQAQRQAALGR